MRRSFVLVVVSLAVLMLSACGNDVSPAGEGASDSGKRTGGRSADDQAYIDELVAAYEANSTSDQLFPAEQMDCFIGDMADGVGVDKLKEVGLTPESVASDGKHNVEALSEVDRGVIGDSFTDCVDLERVVMDSLAADGDEASPAMEQCFAELDWKATEAGFGQLIIAGDDTAAQESGVLVPLSNCMLTGIGDIPAPNPDDLDSPPPTG